VGADPVDDPLRGGAGPEDPGDARLREDGHVLVGRDVAAALAQLLDHGGKEGRVRAGEDRERVYFTSLIVPVPQSGHEVVAPNPR